MENVEIKKEEVKKTVKKKVVKKNKADKGLVAFMEDRNIKRKAAGLPQAYSNEEIESYK